MSLRGAAHIAGAYEHPERVLPNTSTAQIHAEVALGALDDAGLELGDVDGYFCAGDAPGLGPVSMADFIGISPRYLDSTELGGAAYLSHVGHAAAAIAAEKCSVALITLAGRPRSETDDLSRGGGVLTEDSPGYPFEYPYGPMPHAMYAMAARRHMYEYGTTSAQLAEVKAAAASHARHNPHAYLREEVTVEDVLASRMVSDPLHLLDCCVITDGGGALVVVSPEVARDLARTTAVLRGHGEGVKGTEAGRADLTSTAARLSGARAFTEAGITPADVDYIGIYDSFTITVVETIEDLGFCAKGDGGPFVASGALRAPDGALPCNTDGGSLCNNHPAHRGGLTKVVEAVRQLRGEANPAVQVPGCELAVVHGTGGSIATRHACATLVLERAS